MELSRLFILNLKKWRIKKGISQKVLAERCGAAHSYIRQIESGRGYPSFAFIGKLAQALNIEPYQLFYNETKKKTERFETNYSLQDNNYDHNIENLENIDEIKSYFIKKLSDELDKYIINHKSSDDK